MRVLNVWAIIESHVIVTLSILIEVVLLYSFLILLLTMCEGSLSQSVAEPQMRFLGRMMCGTDRKRSHPTTIQLNLYGIALKCLSQLLLLGYLWIIN